MVFSKEGTFLYDIGREGSCASQLKGPFRFVVDRFNNSIVCDYESKSVRGFTLDGKFVNEIGEQELTENLVPWSVAISKNGQLFVTDPAVNCVMFLNEIF